MMRSCPERKNGSNLCFGTLSGLSISPLKPLMDMPRKIRMSSEMRSRRPLGAHSRPKSVRVLLLIPSSKHQQLNLLPWILSYACITMTFRERQLTLLLISSFLKRHSPLLLVQLPPKYAGAAGEATQGCQT